MSDDPRTEMTKMLGVETNTLQYIRAPGLSQCDLCGKGLNHKTVANCAIQFWRKDPSRSEILQQVEYTVQLEVLNGHLHF